MRLQLCILFLSLGMMFPKFLAAQEDNSSNHQETVLKKESLKKGKKKWLNKNGFNTETYDWNDPVINLNLSKAAKRHSTSNAIGFVGGGILVLGLIGNFMGSLSHNISNSKPNESYQVFSAPYYIGGAMVATSIGLSIDSIVKLNKAKKAREKKFK